MGVVKSALAGGVDIVQMREKGRSKEELLSLGIELAGLCRDHNAVFIVNDDPYVARDCGADGVHLGQEDLRTCSVTKAREIMGPAGIIGVSTHSYDQFSAANGAEVDYIAYGPVFPTKTKDYFIGADNIEKIMAEAVKPVVFIGGINEDNIGEILDKGGKNIAVIREITQAEDITAKVRHLKRILNNKKGKTA